MSMYPCSKCKKNSWKFRYHDETGKVEASCVFCKNIISFLSRRKKKLEAGIVIGHGDIAEFRTINGVLERKEKDGNFWPVELVEVKGGLCLIAKMEEYLGKSPRIEFKGL